MKAGLYKPRLKILAIGPDMDFVYLLRRIQANNRRLWAGILVQPDLATAAATGNVVLVYLVSSVSGV
jgi:hypothetical protein